MCCVCVCVCVCVLEDGVRFTRVPLTWQVTESTHPHFYAALKREALEKEQYSQRYPVLEKSVSLGNLPCSSVLVVTLDTASYVVNKESCHWAHCSEGSHPLHSPGV